MTATGPNPLKSLRKAAGLTQMQLAAQAGCSQGLVSKFESPPFGRLPDDETLRGFARALKVSVSELRGQLATALLGGEPLLASEDSHTAALLSAPRGITDRAGISGRATSPLEQALGEAFDPKRHTLGDTRAVQDALGATYQFQDGADALAAARTWLDAAAALRREGKPVTAVTLLDRVTFGKTTRASAVADELSAAANAHGDEEMRKAGLLPIPDDELAEEQRKVRAGAGVVERAPPAARGAKKGGKT